VILDITAINDLAGISGDQGGWRIGAATTWTAIAQADLPPAFDALGQAAREVGAIQIQNSGTIGGNLCNASPAADGVPPLLALDARVELISNAGVRVVPLADFITGVRQTALRDGEILSAVLVPPMKGRSVFSKLGARDTLVISIAMVAARLELDAGRVAKAAVAVGACSPVATRLTALEDGLQGQPVAAAPEIVTADLVHTALSAIDDVRADAEYRADAAVTLIRRAITHLAQEGT
jgi:CO/xanthine dehydrogenase FAD-binding subunit